MLIWFRVLVGVYRVNHISAPGVVRRFLTWFIEHVLQVIYSVHDLLHIGLLPGKHGTDHRIRPAAAAGVSIVDAVDVVHARTGIAISGRRSYPAALDCYVASIKYFQNGVDIVLLKLQDTRVKLVKIRLVELGQIEFGQAVAGQSRPRYSLPWRVVRVRGYDPDASRPETAILK